MNFYIVNEIEYDKLIICNQLPMVGSFGYSWNELEINITNKRIINNKIMYMTNNDIKSYPNLFYPLNRGVALEIKTGKIIPKENFPKEKNMYSNFPIKNETIPIDKLYKQFI